MQYIRNPTLLYSTKHLSVLCATPLSHWSEIDHSSSGVLKTFTDSQQKIIPTTHHTHTHTHHHQSFWLEGLCFSEVMEDQCWLHGIIIWGIRLAYRSPIELSHECSGEGWLKIDYPSRSSCEFQETRRENGGKREWNSGEILTLNVAPKTIFIPNE